MKPIFSAKSTKNSLPDACLKSLPNLILISTQDASHGESLTVLVALKPDDRGSARKRGSFTS